MMPFLAVLILLQLHPCNCGHACARGHQCFLPGCHQQVQPPPPNPDDAELAKKGGGKFQALPAAAIPRLSGKVVDKKFLFASGAIIGATAFDFWTTRRCIGAHTCHEGNPLLGNGLAQEVGVGTAVTSATIVAMFFLKKWDREDGTHDWLIVPALNVGTHVLAGALNLRFSGRKR